MIEYNRIVVWWYIRIYIYICMRVCMCINVVINIVLPAGQGRHSPPLTEVRYLPPPQLPNSPATHFPDLIV